MISSWIGYDGDGDGLGFRSYLFSLPICLLSLILLIGPLTWKKAGTNLLICIAASIILGRINYFTA
jgi:hypothetical protein